jgi:hypothetical protein
LKLIFSLATVAVNKSTGIDTIPNEMVKDAMDRVAIAVTPALVLAYSLSALGRGVKFHPVPEGLKRLMYGGFGCLSYRALLAGQSAAASLLMRCRTERPGPVADTVA